MLVHRVAHTASKEKVSAKAALLVCHGLWVLCAQLNLPAIAQADGKRIIINLRNKLSTLLYEGNSVPADLLPHPRHRRTFRFLRHNEHLVHTPPCHKAKKDTYGCQSVLLDNASILSSNLALSV